MKLTTFNPFIDAANPDELVRLFGELGFERRHTKQGIEIADREDTVIRMKDAGGFYMDIVQSNAGASRDTVGIRINVDDFDAACELLRQHGFRNVFGDDTVATKSSKAAMMVAPSGFCISVIQHIQ